MTFNTRNEAIQAANDMMMVTGAKHEVRTMPNGTFKVAAVAARTAKEQRAIRMIKGC